MELIVWLTSLQLIVLCYNFYKEVGIAMEGALASPVNLSDGGCVLGDYAWAVAVASYLKQKMKIAIRNFHIILVTIFQIFHPWVGVISDQIIIKQFNIYSFDCKIKFKFEWSFNHK